MYGLTSMQMYTYFMSYPQDRPAIKLLVCFSGCPTIHRQVADFEAFDSQVFVLWYDSDCLKDVALNIRCFRPGLRILDTLHVVVVSYTVHSFIMSLTSGPDAFLLYLENRIIW